MDKEPKSIPDLSEKEVKSTFLADVERADQLTVEHYARLKAESHRQWHAHMAEIEAYEADRQKVVDRLDRYQQAAIRLADKAYEADLPRIGLTAAQRQRSIRAYLDAPEDALRTLEGAAFLRKELQAAEEDGAILIDTVHGADMVAVARALMRDRDEALDKIAPHDWVAEQRRWDENHRKVSEHVDGHGNISTVYEIDKAPVAMDLCERWRMGPSGYGWAVYVQGGGPYMSFPTKPLALMVYEFLTGHVNEAQTHREVVIDSLPPVP